MRYAQSRGEHHPNAVTGAYALMPDLGVLFPTDLVAGSKFLDSGIVHALLLEMSRGSIKCRRNVQYQGQEYSNAEAYRQCP